MKVGCYTAFGQYMACVACKSMTPFFIDIILGLIMWGIFKRPDYPCDKCPLFENNPMALNKVRSTTDQITRE